MRFVDPDAYLFAIQRLVEERVARAREEGLFDNLPGKGKPLDLSRDRNVPPHLRASFIILRNSGVLPPELQLRKEIQSLKELLRQTTDEEETAALAREINDKVTAFNIMTGLSISGEMEQVYADKVADRLSSRRAKLELERFEK